MTKNDLVFVGQFTFSAGLTDHTRPYIAVDGDSGTNVNPTIIDGSSPLTVFNVYLAGMGDPRSIVLQPSNFGYQAQLGQALYVQLNMGQQQPYQQYFPRGVTWPLGAATVLQSDLSASDTSTQFWLPAIGAHLVLKTGSNGPTFWVQVNGILDGGKWDVRLVLDAAAAWDNADLRFLQLTTQLEGKSCRSTNFASSDLSGSMILTSDLTGANLTAANLTGADFCGATWNPGAAPQLRSTLTSATLTGAALAGARFDYCLMSGATFTGATCSSGTVFAHADLTGADFSKCDLNGVDFSGATLTNATFTGATMKGTILVGAVLSNATLSGVDLSSAVFSAGTVLKGTQLIGACLDGANLTSIDLTGANLTSASLLNTNFTSATLFSTNFSKTDVTTCIFSNPSAFARDATIPATSFEQATLNLSTIALDWSYLDLTGATIVGLTSSTDLTALNARHLVFKNLDLGDMVACKAVFDNADLSGATLTGIDLTDASLVATTLYGALLANATLTRADFTSAQLGAKQTLFTLPSSVATSLDTGTLSASVLQAFTAAGVPLSANALLTVRIPGQDWLLKDDQNSALYNLVAQGNAITVYGYNKTTDAAAVLTHAYMPDAVFTDANLYACHLSNVQWYGSSAKGDNADFESVDFSGANLSANTAGGMNLKQARMFGASFSNAILVNADLSGASLGASAQNQTVSFAGASLQGTNLAQAKLDGADFTNAAVSVDAGVPLFSLNNLAGAFFTDLDNETLSTDLTTAFQNAGYTLLAGSTVIAVTTGTAWRIENGGETAPDSSVGSAYATFELSKTQSGGLQIYGSSLWITSIGNDGHLSTLQVPFAATGLTEAEMTPVKDFPNGQPPSAYPDRFTWEQMMTAKNPPSPPACVPSPFNWCTPPKESWAWRRLHL